MPDPHFLMYRTDAGEPDVLVRFEGETVWLTQAQMVEPFETTVPNVNIHIRNVHPEGELDAAATIRDYLMVRDEGSRTVQRVSSAKPEARVIR